MAYLKTRLAPTPSGYLHLGNALSFALTATLARANGARILLRIDDMDRERVEEAYVQDIFDTLSFLDIPWDEGPRDAREFWLAYSQVLRLDLYRQALDQLAALGAVFACTCSRNQTYEGICLEKGLPLDTPNAAWRLKVAGALPYFVVRKKDGFPAYQLTSLIDDLYYGVDLIVRGEDLRSSTIAQQELAGVLGRQAFARVHFDHHPLLMETPGRKLSKSEGATSIRYLRAQGYRASEVFQMIGEMLGLERPVADWRGLGEAYLPRLGGAEAVP
jgi:glutamyl-tRNA synthetase